MTHITHPNDTAFPIVVTKDKEVEIGTGIIKREYFAAMAMQGFCSNVNLIDSSARWSVIAADALISELNKDPDEKAKV